MIALLSLAGLLGVAGAAVAYLVLNLPTDAIRDQIIGQVKAKTGRDLTIAGPTSFTLYPSVGLSMGDVSLSAPSGMSGKAVVTMASLDASVRLLPLLKREVAVERLILRKPVFELYVDVDGRKSWSFASMSDHAPVRLAQTGTTATDAAPTFPAEPGAKPQRTAALENLQFDDVRIEDGAIRYADARTGSSHQLTAINAELQLPAIQQPVQAAGNLDWKGEKFDFDGKLTSVKAMLEDKPAKLQVTTTGRPFAAAFDGTLSLAEALDASGTLIAKSPSLRALAAWLGTEFPATSGYGAIETKGQLRVTEKSVSLANAEASLDGATIGGQVAVETAGERPLIRANLKLSELDLNKYIGTGGAKAEPAAPHPPAPPTATAKPPAQSIEDLLEQDATPGAKVKGYTQRAGWSSNPIDVTPLGLVDADAKLTVGRLIYQEIKVGQSQLSVALKSSVIKTVFDDVQLYGGRGRGFITLDGTNPKAASIGANLSAEGVDAAPFLKDAADIDWLSGTAKLSLAVAGQGASQSAIVETLNGKSDFVFANGAIVGINVPGMVRNISQGKLSGLKSAPTEKTDFSELAASWTIANGVAQNQDLKLVSPLLRVSGAGNVSLPARQIDYMMRPKLVASLSGQGGDQNLSGLEIPVRIHGPWNKPEYTPDLESIAKDPSKAIEAVKEIGKQFKGKNANEILNDLFGGGR